MNFVFFTYFCVNFHSFLVLLCFVTISSCNFDNRCSNSCASFLDAFNSWAGPQYQTITKRQNPCFVPLWQKTKQQQKDKKIDTSQSPKKPLFCAATKILENAAYHKKTHKEGLRTAHMTVLFCSGPLLPSGLQRNWKASGRFPSVGLRRHRRAQDTV